MKTVKLKANLLNGHLRYRPLSSEFQTSAWYLRLSSVCFELKSQEDVNEFITVSSNFVTSLKYSDTEELTTYEQPMQLFLLKLTTNSRKSSFRFHDSFWYKVNSSSSQLMFNIWDEKDREVKKNIDITMVFMIFR